LKFIVPIEDDLIWYLTWRVREEEGVPAKTRLVKLLYLIDLLNVRDRNEQATNLEWVFYHYGPYAFGMDAVIERQVGNTIDVATRESYFGDTMFVYRTREHPPATLLPDRLRRYCDEVCGRWANEDLNQLLSYIYFETPPMIGAARGEQLNMRRVREVEWPAYYRALPPPDLDPEWRERREEWRRRTNETLPEVPLDPGPRRDDDYQPEPSEPMESEDADTPFMRGRLVLSVGANED
jgi:hypothetical protein